MSIGIWQIALIVLLVVILFGFGKLPSAMGDIGRGIKNFKKGLSDEDETPKKVARPVDTPEAHKETETTNSDA